MRVRTIQNVFFIALVSLATLAFLGLVQDFLLPLFWAAVLSVLFYPVQRYWLRHTGDRRAIAALLSVVTIVFIVLLPMFLIGLAVTRETVNLYERIVSGEVDVREPFRLVEQALPVVTDYLDRFNIDTARLQTWASEATVVTSEFLAARAFDLGQNAIRITGLAFIMLYILFFFLRDGREIIDGLIRVLPLGDARERRLFEKFASVSKATIKGTLVVGAVQGTLGGLLFWALGIGAPVFWGVVMTVLSLLPAIGSALVWGPAAIILLLSGEVARGIILIVAGTLIIGMVDNILRPLLVGRDTQMPDYIILLSTLGGLALFGLSGFVLGPIIAALFLTVWDMFGEEFAGFEEEPGAASSRRLRVRRIDPPAAEPGRPGDGADLAEDRPEPQPPGEHADPGPSEEE